MDSTVGSGRGCWCGGHGPCTGWADTLKYSTICGNAQTVGLGPVLGAFSISSYSRGLPLLCPLDSTAMTDALSSECNQRHRRRSVRHIVRFRSPTPQQMTHLVRDVDHLFCS